jgi:hypothetical protein
VQLFYDGCIILEIRDYRRKNSNLYDLSFVLLKPSMQTLLADLNSITNTSQFISTQEDKYFLESQLLLATTEPLCLDPSPMVSIVKNNISMQKFKMSHKQLRKFSWRYSEAYKMKAHRWSQYSLPYPFRFLKSKINFCKHNNLNINNGIISKNNEMISICEKLENSRNYSLSRNFQKEPNEKCNSFNVIKKKRFY